MEERKQVITRIQCLTYWYTTEYMEVLDDQRTEEKAIRELRTRADESREIKMVVLSAENNVKVILSCITSCVKAVNILRNEDVEPWMLAGINAMIDKVNETGIVPYDLPISICGLLCSQFK